MNTNLNAAIEVKEIEVTTEKGNDNVVDVIKGNKNNNTKGDKSMKFIETPKAQQVLKDYLLQNPEGSKRKFTYTVKEICDKNKVSTGFVSKVTWYERGRNAAFEGRRDRSDIVRVNAIQTLSMVANKRELEAEAKKKALNITKKYEAI